MQTAPPEVVLDRFIRGSADPDITDYYVGKLDLQEIEPPEYREQFAFIQTWINRVLANEGPNASGGVSHPPFHFDYLKCRDGMSIKNAHAIRTDEYTFVVMTVEMVESLRDLGVQLAHSPTIIRMLDLEGIHPDLSAYFFVVQMLFCVSHEYTHVVHEHGGPQQRFWTEFPEEKKDVALQRHANEIDADGYASALVTTNLLLAEGRDLAPFPVAATDPRSNNRRLQSFLLSVSAFFFSIWRTPLFTETHPPAPVRFDYVIRVVEKWCADNGVKPLPVEEVRCAGAASAATFPASDRIHWDGHLDALRRDEVYRDQLADALEALRADLRSRRLF